MSLKLFICYQIVTGIFKCSVVDPDPDPHGLGTSAWIRIRIQQKVKEYINKAVNSGLFVLLDKGHWTVPVVLNREWQIVVKILLFD